MGSHIICIFSLWRGEKRMEQRPCDWCMIWHPRFICLPLNSIMASKELKFWGLKAICTFVYIWIRRHQQTVSTIKRTPRETLRHLHWSVCLFLYTYSSFLLLARKRSERERKQDLEREGAKLWRSLVHLITGTTVTSPAVSESPVWQPHFLHSLAHKHSQSSILP